MYHSGQGITKDAKQAAYWYEQAAEHGDEEALLTLATLFDMGDRIPRDAQKAAYWYKKAA
jgi:TPR repeat protein